MIEPVHARMAEDLVKIVTEDLWGKGMPEDELEELLQDGDKHSEAIDEIIKYLNQTRGIV